MSAPSICSLYFPSCAGGSQESRRRLLLLVLEADDSFDMSVVFSLSTFFLNIAGVSAGESWEKTH